MAGRVFISYSRVDRAYVERLATHLTAAAILVWYDAEVETGEPFSQRIQQAIDECSAFMVVLTPAAVASDWVRRELSRGARKGKPLFPLLREPCEIPIELDGVQQEIVTEGLMPSQRFVARLRNLLASTGTATLEQSFSGNRDVAVGMLILNKNLGREHEIILQYRWFCQPCNTGGELVYYNCPKCGSPTTRKHRRTARFRVPARPCYGERIRFAGLGPHDETASPPGDLYIELRQGLPFWQRFQDASKTPWREQRASEQSYVGGGWLSSGGLKFCFR